MVLFGVLAMRRRLRGLVTAARAHGLRESTLPRRLLQVPKVRHPFDPAECTPLACRV